MSDVKETYDYDDDVDILYISFAPGEKATAAVELNDNILLRFNLEDKRAVGLTLMDYSILAQPSELGVRHFPLTGLGELEPEWREMVIDMITQPPVNRILKLATYMPTASESIPIISLEMPSVTIHA